MDWQQRAGFRVGWRYFDDNADTGEDVCEYLGTGWLQGTEVAVFRYIDNGAYRVVTEQAHAAGETFTSA